MSMNASRHQIAVIGGGWAGCAAAVTLAQQGHHVSLFEAARIPGGRARRVTLHDMALDNGQHILLGAYRATLNILRATGVKLDQAFLRLPLQMCYAPADDGMHFIAPRLPAPLHLLFALYKAQGLSRHDKMALLRFHSAARWMGWQLNNDCSVQELLLRFDQTQRLIDLLWAPLCIAALNTPVDRASAQIFLSVLRDSLGARRSASDMLIPRSDLSHLFPERALAFVEHLGGRIHLGRRVQSLHPASMPHEKSSWSITLDNFDAPTENDVSQSLVFDGVILATPPDITANLLDGYMDTASLRSLQYESITTCYLQYAPEVRLDRSFYAMQERLDEGCYGQFIFDRGHLNQAHAGLLAVVISASLPVLEQGHTSLSMAISTHIARLFPQLAGQTPCWSKVISEKHATFSCTPALSRPANHTSLNNLVLAGDYTASDYPATLESAVQSGITAANLINEIH